MALHSSLLEGTPELELLYLIGYFDRPASTEAISQFRDLPIIPNVNEKLSNIKDLEWTQSVQKLRQLGLLAPAPFVDIGNIDAHPLVREHFGAVVRDRYPGSWLAGNSRLSDYYRSIQRNETPETILEMEPLFFAIKHGCQAKREDEMLRQVYWPLISRGYKSYLLTVLGAPQTDLSLLSNFFISRWDTPISIPDDVDFSEYPNLRNLVGFRLLALGELEEVSKIFASELEKHLSEKRLDWALISASNLSNIEYLKGDLTAAVAIGKKHVALCDEFDSEEKKRTVGMANVRLAASLYAAGKTDDALSILANKELTNAPERKKIASHIRLSTLATYHYSNILFDVGDVSGIKKAVAEILRLPARDKLEGLVDQLVESMILGTLAHTEGEIEKARRLLSHSVDTAYDSGNLAWVAPSLLARSKLHRELAEYDECRSDLAQALGIARRGQMRLFECDSHLEYARLALAEENSDAALPHFQSADALVTECGYHRRDPEIVELKEKLGL